MVTVAVQELASTERQKILAFRGFLIYSTLIYMIVYRTLYVDPVTCKIFCHILMNLFPFN